MNAKNASSIPDDETPVMLNIQFKITWLKSIDRKLPPQQDTIQSCVCVKHFDDDSMVDYWANLVEEGLKQRNPFTCIYAGHIAHFH